LTPKGKKTVITIRDRWKPERPGWIYIMEDYARPKRGRNREGNYAD
jgi:hypothetical protein